MIVDHFPIFINDSEINNYFSTIAEDVDISDEMKHDMALCETNANPADRCDKCSWYGKIIHVENDKGSEYIPLCAIEEVTKRVEKEYEGKLKGIN